MRQNNKVTLQIDSHPFETLTLSCGANNFILRSQKIIQSFETREYPNITIQQFTSDNTENTISERLNSIEENTVTTHLTDW